jgi:hypothetical protein
MDCGLIETIGGGSSAATEIDAPAIVTIRVMSRVRRKLARMGIQVLLVGRQSVPFIMTCAAPFDSA